MNDNKPNLPPEFQRRLALLQDQYQKADALTQQGKFQDALAAFKSCLDLAEREELFLFVDQLVDILLRIGYCHADLGQYDDALEHFLVLESLLNYWGEAQSSEQGLEQALKQNKSFPPELSQFVPDGIKFGIPESFDPRPYLARVYSSVGLAHDSSGRVPQATDYYHKAVEIYVRLDDKAKAAQVWVYVAVGCQGRQDWENLQRAAENMLMLSTQLEDIKGKITAWEYLAQANVNLDRFDKALVYFKQLVAIENQLGLPDSVQHETLLHDLLALISRQGHVQIRAEARGLEDALHILAGFAYTHGGPNIVNGALRWRVIVEELGIFKANIGYTGPQPSAVLDFHQMPGAIIKVTTTPSEYIVEIMAEAYIPEVPRSVWLPVHSETIPVEVSALLDLLDSFLDKGLVVKSGNRLRYAEELTSELTSKFSEEVSKRMQSSAQDSDLDRLISNCQNAMERLFRWLQTKARLKRSVQSASQPPDESSAEMHDEKDPNQGGDFVELSLKDLTEVIELNPGDAKGYAHRGMIYFASGDHEQAIHDYTNAIELDPNLDEAYYNRGVAYQLSGDLKRAIPDLTRAIELNPNNPMAYSQRGLAYKASGNLEQAIHDYNRAIEFEPNIAEPYNNRGVTHRLSGNLEQAIRDFDKAIALDPDYTFAYQNRAMAHYMSGNLRSALRDFDQALALDPNFALVYFNRGAIHRDFGNLADAIADLEQYLELAPNATNRAEVKNLIKEMRSEPVS